MSIISALRTYVATYAGLKAGAPLWVDYLGDEPTQYSIVPLPGAKTVDEYIDGGKAREYPFALQYMASTADNAERIGNGEFAEAFSDWLDTQTAAGTFPTLGAKQTPTEIIATSWGYLFQQGESSTAVYQISCKLAYEQQP